MLCVEGLDCGMARLTPVPMLPGPCTDLSIRKARSLTREGIHCETRGRTLPVAQESAFVKLLLWHPATLLYRFRSDI